MTALPGLALGPIAGLALRFPGAAKFLFGCGKFFKKNWKQVLVGLAIVAACVSAYTYVKHVEKVSYANGFGAAQAQARAQVEAANKRADADNTQLKLLQQRYAALSVQRQQQVKIVTQTKIERIHDEVQSNPVYRQCALTDGVLDDLQAVAAAVNSSIGSSQH
jgi:hypothetical protein